MGSMKDLLGDDPPTIGDSRRQGMTTFSVHCAAPCGHVSTLAFDALRLPDETFFIDIPKKRRLRCSSCGRRAMEISANWTEVVFHGNGRRSVAGWIVVCRTPDGVEARSNPQASRERAISLAFDLADKGDVVLRIEGPGGDVGAEEIEAQRGRQTSRGRRARQS